MTTTYTKTKVLITVMTYPHPSTKYEELVCTAGITDQFEWVRLYPIDYRYRPEHQQFHKYQWIEIELDEKGNGNDKRKESRRPHLESIRLLGEPLSHKHGWRDRCSIIDRMPVFSLNQLHEMYEKDRTSLGIVKPKKIHDLIIEPADPEWKPEWQEIFNQLRLFEPPPKPLRKLPFRFSYVFECNDSLKPHKAMIEEWELGVLFLKEADRLGSDEKAAESVKRKYLDEICSPKNDTRFFMGTVFPYNTWVVIGTFRPPKKHQLELEFSLPLGPKK